jgi:SAM-dependent methyltransferase
MASTTTASLSASDYTLQDQRLMREAQNYFAWQGRLVRAAIGRRVVEVGCGVGNFTAMLLDREVVIAVDKEPGCVAQIKERYANSPNVRAFVGDPCDADFSQLARYSLDSCVCLNVLEHISDDRGALEHMVSVLAPGGVIVLIVPAFPGLYGPIDSRLGHFRRYTRKSLHQCAASAGLSVKQAHYLNFAGFFGWWANARVFRREEQSAGQIKFFDRCVVPVISRLESLVRPPFGQSLFAVLQKP